MNLKQLFAGLLLASLVALIWVQNSVAAPVPQVDQPISPATEPIDVVVVLDDSGSMATCWPWPQQAAPFNPPCRAPSINDPSDPDELRYSAARLLLHLADDADRVAMIRFDSTVEGIGLLGTLQTTGSAERRRILASSLQPPTNYLIRGYTRIDLGLEEAARLLESSRLPNRNQYVLLLTDGEPTEPPSAAGQKGRIAQHINRLQEDGVLVFPVVLCTPTSGCPAEFLREQFGPDVREAQNATELLRVFSEVFSEMKVDRSVVTTRDLAGNLVFNTRPEHGVGQLAFVSPRSAINSVRRGESTVVTQSLLDDGNIDLNVISGNVPAGEWTVETGDPSAFAVIQADSYPELLFPPPSAANSPASIRYYPAGKTPLIVARGAGPAAGDPLLLNGQMPIPSMGTGNFASMPLPAASNEISIQLGSDSTPLQLQRSFRLAALPDLPGVEVVSPTPANPGILEDGRTRFEIGLAPGADVENVQAIAYVTDITDGDRQVYQATLTCHDRSCSDEGFTPADGRSYRVLFLLTANSGDLRFGDWAQGTLNVEPAIYLSGLPATLDLRQMPADGWPVSVMAGTTEEIGTLNATLELRHAESGERVPEVSLQFSAQVDEKSATESLLRVTGMDRLRPGRYEGEISLSVTSPAGRPMDVKIRPAPLLPVTLLVDRSVARIQSQIADFGERAFETSPNFRLNEEIALPVIFERGSSFRLTAEVAESSCSAISVTSGDLQQAGDGYLLPLRLQSGGPVGPSNCTGVIRFSGPTEDFDILPAQLNYRLRIPGLEWSILGELNLGNLGQAGERSTQTLLVRFNGQTPFTLRMLDFNAAGETDSGLVELDQSYVEMVPVEVRGEPNANGFYEVPITLVARKAIPLDTLRGTLYRGDLMLAIDGLPNESRTVNMGFRSPTLYQRYVAWWLHPIYSLPLLLCTGPLTLLLLLVLLARVRSGGTIYEEEEPVVTLPQGDFGTEPAGAFVTPSFERATAPANDGAWESQWSADWGSSTSSSSTSNQERERPRSVPATTRDDPWASAW
jgi:hypothetical protein